jgi:cell division protein FtsL
MNLILLIPVITFCIMSLILIIYQIWFKVQMFRLQKELIKIEQVIKLKKEYNLK